MTTGDCIAVDSIEIEVVDLNVSLPSNQSLCAGETYEIIPTTNGDFYAWQDGSTTSTYVANSSGTYWLEVTTGDCTAVDSIEIEMIDLNVNLPIDQNLCAGETYEIIPTTNGDFYEWQDGSTTSTYVASNGGIYWLEVTTGDCTAVDSIEIEVVDLNVSLPSNQSLCAGETYEIIPTTNGDFYAWQDGSTTSTYVANSSGTYWLEVTTGDCTAVDSIEIEMIDLNVNLPIDQSLCTGEIYEIVPITNGDTYEWQDGSTSSSYLANLEDIYWLEVSFEDCTVRDSIELIYEKCESCKMFIPNVFSPNGDNINDFLTWNSACYPVSFEALIFDRWGNEVFSTNDYDNIWNGSYKGEKLDNGVYIVVVNYRFEDSESSKTIKQGVQILR